MYPLSPGQSRRKQRLARTWLALLRYSLQPACVHSVPSLPNWTCALRFNCGCSDLDVSITSLAVVAVHDVGIAKQRVPEHSYAEDSTTKRPAIHNSSGQQPEGRIPMAIPMATTCHDMPRHAAQIAEFLRSPAGFGTGESPGLHWPDPDPKTMGATNQGPSWVDLGC